MDDKTDLIPVEGNKTEPEVIEKKKKTDTSIPFNTFARKYFPILSQLEDVQLYRIHKSEILSAAQKTVLKYALSEKKMEKANFLQLLQGFEILNKAERLDLGKTTENVGSMFFGKVEVHNFNDSKE